MCPQIACLKGCILTLHYRLRGPIGLLNVQKVSKSRRLFLTEGTSKTDNFALFVKIMTQIFAQLFSARVGKVKLAKKVTNVSKSLNGGSDGADFLCGKSINHN